MQNPPSPMKFLDFNAFYKRRLPRLPYKKMLIVVVVAMICLAFVNRTIHALGPRFGYTNEPAPYMCRYVSERAVNPLCSKKRTESLANLINAVGSTAVIGWIFVLIMNRPGNEKDRTFQSFAHANNLQYIRNPRANLDYTETGIKLLDFGPTMNVVQEYYTHGTVGHRRISMSIVTARSKNYYAALGHYYGFFACSLSRAYTPHIVADSTNYATDEWDKTGTSTYLDVLGALKVGYRMYRVTNTDLTIGAQIDSASFINFLQTVKNLDKNISLEVYGDTVYFLKKDGLDLNPEGMRKQFQLIEAVDMFDKPGS